MRKPGREPGSVVLVAFEFAHWAHQLPKPPTWREIQGYLQCTPNKARTWRQLWLKSLGRTPLSPAPTKPHPSSETTP
jgi:hypothetical protein